MLIVLGTIPLSGIETTLHRNFGKDALGVKSQISVLCVQTSKVHRFTKDVEDGVI